MGVQSCPADTWTTVTTTTANTLIEARDRSVYITTDETPPTDPTEGYYLRGGEAMVVQSGLTVKAYPVQSLSAAKVIFIHI